MNILTSVIFTIFFILWSAIIPILYSFNFILRSSKIADHGAMVWSRSNLWVLKKLCGVDHRVLGLENIPKQGCIIACKHQSIWETLIMHLIMKRPVYTFKKELLSIPFYGWYLTLMSIIKIDRKGGASSLKSLIKQSKTFLSQGHNIVLFPQGTRTPIDASTKDYPYQSGVAALYLSCGVPVIPARLNSGEFWPKKGIKKKAGTIRLTFLEPIQSGLPKKDFMRELESKIEG